MEALAEGLIRGPEYVNLTQDDRQTAGRDPAQRRAYIGRPVDYCREILGVELTTAQERILRKIFDPVGKKRILIRAGNNLGKTFVLACAVLYIWDVLASELKPGKYLEEQGAVIILCGPTEKLVADTMYRQILEVRAQASARGFNVVGRWSEPTGADGEAKGITPKVDYRERWYLSTITPPKKAGEKVATPSQGRHHRNLWIFLCEASGIAASVWAAADVMASGDANRVVADLNPTDPTAEAYRRAQMATWDVEELSSLDHPNVRERREVVGGGAISCGYIEGRILEECQCLGPYPGTDVDVEKCDFVYAHPRGIPEKAGPREDGYPGHPDAPLQVWRPSGLFVPQVLGRFPLDSQDGLFDMQAWNRAVARWKLRRAPARPPDRLGFDVAREGKDSSVGAPAWGRPAPDLMRAWRDAEVEPAAVRADDDDFRPAPAEDIMRALMRGQLEEREEPTEEDQRRAMVVSRREMMASDDRRLYIGSLVVARKGDGPQVIEDTYRQLTRAGIDAPLGWVVDELGVGYTVIDNLGLRGVPRHAVSAGGSPLPKLPDEVPSENMRTQMAIRLAWLVKHDLVDLPDDQQLMEEARVARISYGERPVTELGQRETPGRSKTRTVARLMGRQDFIDATGRSPDRLTAVCLAAMPLNTMRMR